MNQGQLSKQQVISLSIALPSLLLVIGTTLFISYASRIGAAHFAPIELIYYISRLSPLALGLALCDPEAIQGSTSSSG